METPLFVIAGAGWLASIVGAWLTHRYGRLEITDNDDGTVTFGSETGERMERVALGLVIVGSTLGLVGTVLGILGTG